MNCRSSPLASDAKASTFVVLLIIWTSSVHVHRCKESQSYCQISRVTGLSARSCSHDSQHAWVVSWINDQSKMNNYELFQIKTHDVKKGYVRRFEYGVSSLFCVCNTIRNWWTTARVFVPSLFADCCEVSLLFGNYRILSSKASKCKSILIQAT